MCVARYDRPGSGCRIASTLTPHERSDHHFLATFAGVGRALFSDLDDALEWCDRRAEEQFPGAVVEWREPEGPANVGTGQPGQQRHRQEPKPGQSIPPLGLGSVVAIPVDAEL